MKRYFDSKLGMYKSVESFLTKNMATITAANIPILVNYRVSLMGMIDVIRTTSGETTVDTRGITLTKADAEDKAVNLATIVAGMLYSYAADNINIELKENMKGISISMLKVKKDEEVIDALWRILHKAQEVSTVTPPAPNPLIPYGFRNDVMDGNEITERGTLTQFDMAIQIYARLTTAPRNAINTRKTYNEALEIVYKETDLLLDKMDKIVKSMKDTFPSFYTGYQNARNIPDSIRKYTKITGTITNNDGKPIPNVTITLVSTTDPLVTYEGMSDDEGKYAIRTPKFRLLYNVNYSRSGYSDIQKSDIKVKLGKATRSDVKMTLVKTK